METLRWTRTMTTISGVCLQPDVFTPCGRILYNIYANVGVALLNVLVFAQILDIFINVKNQDEFTENFSITSTVFMIALKSAMMSSRLQKIVNLIEQLDKNLFLPVTKQEKEIRSKFDRIIELITKTYTAGIAFFSVGIFFLSIVVQFKERKLATRIWVPYDYTPMNLFIATSAFEFIVAIFAVSTSVACENIYAALMLHICCQFEILEHRFNTLSGYESYPTNQCAAHHHQIYMYAERVNNEFKGIVSCQFFFSMSALCLNLNRILNAEKFSQCMEAISYSICVYWQIFFYCFFGDLVKGKSIDFADVIFEGDWPSWNKSSKKVLWMAIRRSKVPIEFTSMHMISLNLESFMSLVKTSYSAFNLMQTST